jgi:eukaryotic-like serine/threonine-protein kinase
MTIGPGARLGPYEIVSAIGVGGMGEVYRARDTKLGREVAIKVLPPALTSDPERLVRFTREAQVLAALNHPNIAAIHHVEETANGPALVMELVEGETLADRIARGPIPFDEVLPIAKQIAEALEAAHEQGIIHRDLKPANIKVRSDGTVKVLDFGLAKLTDPASGSHVSAANASMSPTITSPAMVSGVGVLLGTAAYMSPEQAKGKAADKRSDIWSFGCVLYEMLTGRGAFPGDDVADVLVAVLSKDPDWEGLPPSTPPALRRLLRRSLQRDRARRLADIADARLDLDEAAAVPAAFSASATFPPSRKLVPAIAAAAFAAALVTGTILWRIWPVGSHRVARFTITLPADQQFTNTARTFVAISPDGAHIAYAGRDGDGPANLHLYVRSIDSLNAVAIPGIGGPAAISARVPFFSPDSRWLGFWHNGQIKKVSISGGVPISIASAMIPMGASWSADDSIVYAQESGGIWRVSAVGGAPTQIVKVNSGERAYGPQLLPDGRAILFTVVAGNDWNDAEIVVQSLENGARHTVVKGGTDGRYLSTGHLLYATRGALLAVPFSLSSLTTTGGAISLADNVGESGVASGAAHYAVSADGTLVYVPGSPNVVPQGNRRLVWVDRAGHEFAIGAPPRPYTTIALSPDGERLAYSDPTGDVDIWTYEFRRGIFERLTSDPAISREPVWSPDGRRIAYRNQPRTGGTGVFVRNADGTGDSTRLTTGTHIPVSWSRDGSRLVYIDFGPEQITPTSSADLAIITLGADLRTEKLVAEPGGQTIAAISPDGRWLAYESNEPGETAVFARRFPDVSAGRWRISNGTGRKPVWARDSRTLFYNSGQAMMAVDVAGATPAMWSAPRKLFEGSFVYSDAGTTFDVAPDGRFLMLKEDTAPISRTPDALIVVQNWPEDLKRLVPTK